MSPVHHCYNIVFTAGPVQKKIVETIEENDKIFWRKVYSAIKNISLLVPTCTEIVKLYRL